MKICKVSLLIKLQVLLLILCKHAVFLLKSRCEQGSNLRGETPLDFKSNALTTRPSQHSNTSATLSLTCNLQDRYWSFTMPSNPLKYNRIATHYIQLLWAVLELSYTNRAWFTKELAHSTGFEPVRAEPNRFLVYRLNHSATIACTLKKWTSVAVSILRMRILYKCYRENAKDLSEVKGSCSCAFNQKSLSEVGFEPTPGEPDCDLNAAP